MRKSFRIALALRTDMVPAARKFFLGAHGFAHTKSDWKVVWKNGTSLLSWDEALEARPDGILGILLPDQKITERRTGRARVVTLNTVSNSYPFSKVMSDGREAARRGVIHLVERKLQHFAFVGSGKEFFSEQRAHGFRETLRAIGHGTPAPVIDFGGLSHPPSGFQSWLKSLPLPCGILCANDLIGMNVIMACLRAGLAVPEEIAVLGISNDRMVCVESPVPLSSVEQHFETVGRQGAMLLDELLRGRPAPSEPILVSPGEVVARESTRVFGIGDSLVRRALLIIHDYHTEPLTMPALLSRLGHVSQRLVEMRFKKTLGRSPYQEIIHARISHAQRLLRSTRRSLEEIASEAGFYDPAQFSRHFRHICKTTPSQYRKAHQAE